jgi:hypothetical protein
MNQDYFDHLGLMQPWGENSILYTTEWAYLRRMQATYELVDGLMLTKALNSQIERDKTGKPTGLYQALKTETWSHDNHTALVALDLFLNGKYQKITRFPKDFWRRLHPRDIIWYGFSMRGLLSWAFLPLLWVSSLCMLWSCRPHYKVIDGQKVLATDGMLLTWLRCQATAMPTTWYLATRLVKNFHRSWSTPFATYFRDQNHPNRLIAKELFL